MSLGLADSFSCLTFIHRWGWFHGAESEWVGEMWWSLNDGRSSVSGCYQEHQAWIWLKAPHAVWMHFIIHREALAAETLSGELHDVLKTVIKVVNFIKTNESKIFIVKLWGDMGVENSRLLFYSSSQWQSLSNSLLKLYLLRNEI